MTKVTLPQWVTFFFVGGGVGLDNQNYAVAIGDIFYFVWGEVELICITYYVFAISGDNFVLYLWRRVVYVYRCSGSECELSLYHSV
jgi:hypothetical protein